ncbi:uncharacterized protein LOC124543292 [Vanessa cardui]|uniref:uncharacterized protein LOC124543292 n=1 Tax=Vanessa cardui TaxID=171605 RepID=UPI001F13D51A|nr:uncharacterized protein LOC124543292 [Vanessa cardui]
MISKTVFALAVLSVLVPMLAATPLQARSSSPVELVSIIALEEACVRQGGICVRIDDCQPGNRVQMKSSLCPLQRHLGVECCYFD